jgi:hypothetical protein
LLFREELRYEEIPQEYLAEAKKRKNELIGKYEGLIKPKQ